MNPNRNNDLELDNFYNDVMQIIFLNYLQTYYFSSILKFRNPIFYKNIRT